MREFKFACPVCGQHISAAAGTSGTQIECPTCFQKIIVPPERKDDSKLILHAAKADRPRPPQTQVQEAPTHRATRRNGVLVGIGLVVLLALIAGAAYVFQDRLGLAKNRENMVAKPGSRTNAVPPAFAANLVWTRDLKRAEIPSEPVTGSLRGQPFSFTRATLQGGTLSIRQGKGWPPELAVAILFPAKRGEDLAGKQVQVAADQPPPVPKVVLRWKTAQGTTATRSFSSGYLLRLNFGEPEGNRMPGEIYIALPDDEKSFLAGTFVAEVRPPDAPKKKTRKAPPPPTSTVPQ